MHFAQDKEEKWSTALEEGGGGGGRIGWDAASQPINVFLKLLLKLEAGLLPPI